MAPFIQNKNVAKPDMRALLELLKEEIFLQLNCHALGTIQSFDSETQTANVTINYQKTFFRGQNLNDPDYQSYPVLQDCPVIVLAGGTASLTFPIAAGDTCLVLFNDRDIDNWFSSGQVMPLASARMHSFTDAVVLVGLRSLQNKIADYDTDHALLSWGETKVGVSEEKVLISNELATLNDLLQDLIDQIKLITVTCAGSGSPSSTPINAAAIAAVATQIGDLLE